LNINKIKDKVFDLEKALIKLHESLKRDYKEGIIVDGEGWLNMLQDRNQTSHTYDEDAALEIFENIKKKYATLFDQFLEKMKNLVSK